MRREITISRTAVSSPVQIFMSGISSHTNPSIVMSPGYYDGRGVGLDIVPEHLEQIYVYLARHVSVHAACAFVDFIQHIPYLTGVDLVHGLIHLYAVRWKWKDYLSEYQAGLRWKLTRDGRACEISRVESSTQVPLATALMEKRKTNLIKDSFLQNHIGQKEYSVWRNKCMQGVVLS